jgi:hypothetical protein
VLVAVLVLLEDVVGPPEAMAPLAHEPTRELQRAHPDDRRGILLVALRRLAEVVGLGEIEVRREGPQARQQRTAEAWIVERRVVAGPNVVTSWLCRI